MNHFEDNIPDINIMKKYQKSVNESPDVITALAEMFHGKHADKILRNLDSLTWALFTKGDGPIQNSELFRVYSIAMSKYLPEGVASFRNRILYHIWRVWSCGSPIYRVTNGLGHALANTELRGLLCDDLRLPYPAIFVEVPEAADLKIWNPQSGWHTCCSAYVFEVLEPHNWDILLVGESKGVLGNVGTVTIPDDALSYYNFTLPPGMRIEDAMRLNQDKYEQNKYQQSFGEMSQYWPKTFKWVMNLVLYVTNVEVGRRFIANREARQLVDRLKKARGKKARGIKERLSRISRQEYMMVGEGFNIQDRSENTVRVLVSGHWKRIHHGPGSSLTKRAFIEPYWRGPDIGEVSKRKKLVGGK